MYFRMGVFLFRIETQGTFPFSHKKEYKAKNNKSEKKEREKEEVKFSRVHLR